MLYPVLPCSGCGVEREHRQIGTDVRARSRAVYECTVCCSTCVREPVMMAAAAPAEEPCNCGQALRLQARVEELERMLALARRRP